MYDDYQGRGWEPASPNSGKTCFAGSNQYPESVGLYNSDASSFCSWGVRAGVTVSNATYRKISEDAGVKWRGFAFNTEYFARWPNRFTVDGLVPIGSTFNPEVRRRVQPVCCSEKMERVRLDVDDPGTVRYFV